MQNKRPSPRHSGMVSQTRPLDCYRGSTRSLSTGRIIIPGTTMKVSSHSFFLLQQKIHHSNNKSLPGYRYIGFLEQVLQLQCVSIMKHIKRVHPKCMNLPQFRWDTRIFRKRFFAYQWGTYYALIQIFLLLLFYLLISIFILGGSKSLIWFSNLSTIAGDISPLTKNLKNWLEIWGRCLVKAALRMVLFQGKRVMLKWIWQDNYAEIYVNSLISINKYAVWGFIFFFQDDTL